MKKKFKKIFLSIIITICIAFTFIFATKTNVKASITPQISINQFHVTWSTEIESGVEINGINWNLKPFYCNGVQFSGFSYRQSNETNFRVLLYYDTLLVYDNAWLKQEYRVISFASESDFLDATKDFIVEFQVNPFTIGYNIPINLNNSYYRFTNSNPTNNTGNRRIWLDFYTTYFVPVEWTDSSGSYSVFEAPRNYWNNLYVTSDSIDYCYSFNSNDGLATQSFILLNNNEWSQNGGMGVPQDQVIRITDTDVSYDVYVFLIMNGYFGSYTELTYTPTDPSSFGALVKSIANTPIEIIQSILDVNMLGLNLFSVFCGIITIFLVIFVIKRIT